MTPAAVLAANTERAAERLAEWEDYDPLLGIGSPLERVPVRWRPEGEEIHVPVAMLDDPEWGGYLRRAAEGETMDALTAHWPAAVDPWLAFIARRIRYDYEFWCATCVTVKAFRTGEVVPFVLLPLQRASLRDRETVRLAGRPVRQIEVKGRRYGSTTDKRCYVWWLSNVVSPGNDALLVALDKGGNVADIASKYEALAVNHPPWGGTFTPEAVRNSHATRRFAETGSKFSIASVNNPTALSGFEGRYALVSEIGKMPSNAVQSAERLITDITSIVPQAPDTYIALESTTERVGALFRTYVHKAARGEGGWSLTFSCWTDDPNCWVPLDESNHVAEAGSPEAWVAAWLAEKSQLATRLRFLWKEGYALEQIAFFESVGREKPDYTDALQEYPLSWKEAFQYGKRRRFRGEHVLSLRASCREPARRGHLVARGTTGRAALQDIEFVDDPAGNLSVWREPGEAYGLVRASGPADPWAYSRAYLVTMDIGGVWEGADFTVVTVFDRRPLAHGAPPEVVAEWRGHLDQDLAAWVAARIAAWYHDALLAPEINSLREDMGEEKELEADHGATVLEEIALDYRNIYKRRVWDRRSQEQVEKLGWHTNKHTKVMGVDALAKWLREHHTDGGGYVERELGACDEMEGYLVMPNGAMQAAPKTKDDRVATRFIGAAINDQMAPPTLSERARQRRDYDRIGTMRTNLAQA